MGMAAPLATLLSLSPSMVSYFDRMGDQTTHSALREFFGSPPQQHISHELTALYANCITNRSAIHKAYKFRNRMLTPFDIFTYFSEPKEGPMTVDEVASSSSWSREQDKAFENALATLPEDAFNRWERIASDVPGKTLEEIKQHYELLVDDVNLIESGSVPLPCYNNSSDGPISLTDDEENGKKGGHISQYNGESNNGGKGPKSDQERRKGIAWTEDEHRLFLLGLDKYGKGDWRSISRNFVVTRTPTQVASHAQKYFIRLNSMNKERRRSSIHDITSVENSDVAAPQGPITGQANGSVGSLSGKSTKQPTQSLVGTSGIRLYGSPTIGQPVGPLGSAAPAHMAYGVKGTVPGAVSPGASMSKGAVAYPMPHTSGHR